MATTQEIQLFDALLEKGLDQDKAKSVVIKARETNRVDAALWGLWIKEEVKVEATVPQSELKGGFSPAPWFKAWLSIGEISRIGKEAQWREKIESEQWLAWFVTESKEALWRRTENIKESLKLWWEEKARNLLSLVEKAKTDWVGAALFEWFKQAVTPDIIEGKESTELQVWGQVIAGWLDVIFEWLENLIQEFTPEEVEQGIESAVAKIWETETVQNIAKSYNAWKEKNPTAARNVEWAVNVWQILPIEKAFGVITKPFSKSAQTAARKWAEQSLRDTGRSLLNIWAKKTGKEQLDLTNFFAKNVDPTDSFDDVVGQFTKKADDAISQVDTSLKSSTTLHKPQGAIEVLKVIDDNLKNIAFSWPQKKVIKDLIKKFNGEWLNLSDLNRIKRSINEYTKAWTAAGREAAWLNPGAIRGKYTEIRKFIENTAKREWLPDIGDLNQTWMKANELMETLGKQALKVGKQKWLATLQPKINKIGQTIFDFRRKLWLTDISAKKSIWDLNLKDILNQIKQIQKATESKWILESLGSISLKEVGKDIAESGLVRWSLKALKWDK